MEYSVFGTKTAVLGGGNCAQSLSCYLSSLGCEVSLWVRNLEHLTKGVRQGHIKAYGKMEGIFPLCRVTDNIEEAVKDCDYIFVATVTTAYPDVAKHLAPYLQPHQTIVTFSSKLAGSVEFENAIKANNPSLRENCPRVVETDALFASRLQPDESLWVRGVKRWNLFSTPRHCDLPQVSEQMLQFFPGLKPADNVIQRGLTDFGALAHPLTMLVNMNRVDHGESFLFYCDGFTEHTISLVRQLENEFRAVAKAFNTDIIPPENWLDNYYGCSTSSLLDAMRSVPNYQTSKSPTCLQHRYIIEDVSCTITPLHYLGKTAQVETPLADSIITLAQVITGINFLEKGRTFKSLGWDGLSYDQLKRRIA